MKKLLLPLYLFLVLLLGRQNIVHAQNQLNQKLMMGYQGWFLAPGDQSAPNEWRHWFRSTTNPAANQLTVDMWPDMSEYTQTYSTNMTYANGTPAKLFSSHNLSTTNIHFKWMKDYNIYGVYLQRFLGEAVGDPRFFSVRNNVLQNVITASATHDRHFSIMYDISGVADDGNLYNKLVTDWEYLVNTYQVNTNPQYVKQNGLPVLAIWGIGFSGRGLRPETFQALINYFHNTAAPQYRAYIVGGVPDSWRTLNNDSESDPRWRDIYHSLDMISPWTVGRYSDFNGVDNWKNNKIIPDMQDATANGVDYMPVIWPGFSWFNLHAGPQNQIPRQGGNFYWRQAYNALNAGADFLYVAMFDEVDESTAMFKVSATAATSPAQGFYVNLNADGQNLPSDWYLRLANETQKMLDGSAPLTNTIPISPNGATVASSSSGSLAEGTSNTGSFTITGTGLTANITVGYTISGTASSADYTVSPALTGSVTLTPANPTVTFTLSAVNDNIQESLESIILTPSAGAGYTVTTISSNLGITDNDTPPVVSSAGTASGITGSSFSYTITASNSPTSYGATGLPAGLSVNTSTGVISGTPTATGTFNSTVTATNSSGTGSKALTITITTPPPCTAPYINLTSTAPTIDTSIDAVWANATVGSINNVTLGARPADFTGSQWRALYDNTNLYILVEVKDANRFNDSGGNWWEDDVVEIFIDGNNSKGTSYDGVNDFQYGFRYNDAAIKIGGSSVNRTTGVTFIQHNVTNGYNIEVRIPWSTIGVTPISGNKIGFDVSVDDDDNGGVRDAQMTAFATTGIGYTNPSVFGSVTLCSGTATPAPVVSNASLPTGTVNSSYSTTITASNSPTSFGATGLPAGLSVNTSSGVISGTPTASGTFTVTLSATNASGTGTKQLSLVVNPAGAAPVVSNTSLPTGTVGTAYNTTITATNNPTSFGATGLPAGLSVNTSTGVISGTPTASGTFTVTLSATNVSGTGTKQLSLVVNPAGAAPVVSNTSLPTGTVGAAYNTTITATNNPTSRNATGLPAGLSVNTSTGVISGTPTASGTFTVTLSATNASGTGTKQLSLVVNPAGAAPVVSNTSLPTGTVGTAYNTTITATNNPTSRNATGLPAGLSVNTSTGVISGTPTASGTFTVTLSATNASGTGTKQLSLVVNPAGDPPGVVTCLRTSGTITVNGTLAETNWNSVITKSISKSISGSPNNTATFGVLWDNTNLYVGVRVLDANLHSDSPNTWDDDAVEVYIDANNNKLTTYDGRDNQIIKNYNKSTVFTKLSVTGLQHGWAAITGGYSVELAIPWSQLGVAAPAAGQNYGFDVGYDDDDNAGARDHQAVWNGTINNYQNTSAFGTLTLSNTAAARMVAEETEASSVESVKIVYWPNPVDQEINLATDGSYEALEVIDMLGKSIRRDDDIFGKMNIKVDMSSAVSGVHLIRLNGKSKSELIRIIKK